jgi:hypothetical protein
MSIHAAGAPHDWVTGADARSAITRPGPPAGHLLLLRPGLIHLGNCASS